MINTLRTNIKNPARRKMMYARFGGKMIGLAAVIGMIYGFAYLFSTSAASATPVHSAAADLKAQLTTPSTRSTRPGSVSPRSWCSSCRRAS